ncbi:23S rRNA (guanine(745)-N(1))-methyltransferase [Vibrio sp. D404a]|uniref:23S rRNA (guanine(745)-N(1))-methyltransferase n=1 Tax=unclassified Vibrio TaxID=2614977 RepID=UPI002555051D|nr:MULTISPECIES: 23S rRNA (guanine(745)-N(1))-methyltransferase [unclassified Vibrio]MDK9736735.1 23S rRNA (guanine(745)-N(1))-methyltransferase [Vibrio sp. D404a]MDK9797044.1 23S rRNA (guanine(745)-N(1))-methyltransferase [Vibrio sp. D449a]
MNYQCPLCHQSLNQVDRTFKCENNHQFDLAKEGYVNLMPAHHKRSKDPGDNKEMMQARRRFLEGDHYNPMRQAVVDLCEQVLPTATPTLLDIGCGEGYYTNEIAERLTQREPSIYGLDISKVAIRYAAKRYPAVDFSVASSHRLPFASNSLDAILRIYAPCKAEELQRTLKDQGVVITVTPAGRHLYQLRDEIYDGVRLHDETPEVIEGFTLESQQHLNYMMELSGSDAFDLLQMTPFAWKASESFKQQLLQSESYQCEADFLLRVYRKQS